MTFNLAITGKILRSREPRSRRTINLPSSGSRRRRVRPQREYRRATCGDLTKLRRRRLCRLRAGDDQRLHAAFDRACLGLLGLAAWAIIARCDHSRLGVRGMCHGEGRRYRRHRQAGGQHQSAKEPKGAHATKVRPSPCRGQFGAVSEPREESPMSRGAGPLVTLSRLFWVR
jgi:hypothetical protein